MIITIIFPSFYGQFPSPALSGLSFGSFCAFPASRAEAEGRLATESDGFSTFRSFRTPYSFFCSNLPWTEVSFFSSPSISFPCSCSWPEECSVCGQATTLLFNRNLPAVHVQANTHRCSPLAHLSFITFVAIPFIQFTPHLPHRLFTPFCRYPFRSVYAIPRFTAFRPFCRYPFQSVANQDK